MGEQEERQARFERLYDQASLQVLGYALRRADSPEDAADVVSETFMIAWRRLDEVPAGDEARLWLYGVARRVLSNHHRGGVRRERLGERLRQRLRATVSVDPGNEVPQRLTIRNALAKLGELDREVLMLTFWEGLEPRETAAVLELDSTVVRTRLSRARTRMRNLLGHDLGTRGHVLDVMATRTPKEAR